MHGALLLSSKVSKEIDPANPNFLWGSTLGEKNRARKLRSVKYKKVQRYTLSQLLHMLSGYWKIFHKIIIVALICKLAMESLHTMTNVQVLSKFVPKCDQNGYILLLYKIFNSIPLFVKYLAVFYIF